MTRKEFIALLGGGFMAPFVKLAPRLQLASTGKIYSTAEYVMGRNARQMFGQNVPITEIKRAYPAIAAQLPESFEGKLLHYGF